MWQRVLLVLELCLLVVIVGSFFADYSIKWAILLNIVLLVMNFVVSLRAESRKERDEIREPDTDENRD